MKVLGKVFRFFIFVMSVLLLLSCEHGSSSDSMGAFLMMNSASSNAGKSTFFGGLQGGSGYVWLPIETKNSRDVVTQNYEYYIGRDNYKCVRNTASSAYTQVMYVSVNPDVTTMTTVTNRNGTETTTVESVLTGLELVPASGTTKTTTQNGGDVYEWIASGTEYKVFVNNGKMQEVIQKYSDTRYTKSSYEWKTDSRIGDYAEFICHISSDGISWTLYLKQSFIFTPIDDNTSKMTLYSYSSSDGVTLNSPTEGSVTIYKRFAYPFYN